MTAGAPSPANLVRVAVELPQHAGLAEPLDYLCEHPLAPGTLVRVPLGRREVVGIVWPPAAVGPAQGLARRPDAAALRPVAGVLDAITPLPPAWCALVGFAAGYYQRAVGELALAVLPPELRRLEQAGLARLDKWLASTAPAVREVEASAPVFGALDPVPSAAGAADAVAHAGGAVEITPPAPDVPGIAASGRSAPPLLGAAQAEALARLRAAGAVTALLHGVTGSGKTEVYLRAVEDALAAGRQALVLVPEINLTPQLEARFAERFAGRRLVSLHSGLSPAQRLRHWLAAHHGMADVVLGTRLAVFTPLPRLGLVVVDEEHDPSYKQQEGARYSARDLAVYRGRLEGVPVVLGSATPSLESWQHALAGRYLKLDLPERVGAGAMPRVRVVDMTRLPRTPGASPVLAPPLLAAMRERIARGEQCMVFLNRRGYAPVLQCEACGWKSGCPHCSAWRVFHKLDRTLRCHHCGFTERVPRACPDCGNLDIAPVGRGTERLEEQLGEAIGEVETPEGSRPARVARIDADVTRRKGALESSLAAVHAGEVDVLVGTQMIAKGHDFRRITLVAAVSPDVALFASDFRAAERLFALLMQAGGRAGRDAAQAERSEMWVQTWQPAHPLYAALRRHDFAAFAASQLDERRQAGLPPYASLALLRAEARTAEAAGAFLQAAAQALAALLGGDAAEGDPARGASALGPLSIDGLTVYPPVPPTVARVANVERMQMLLESPSRRVLQRALAAWSPALTALRTRHRGVLRWAIDVDPLAI